MAERERKQKPAPKEREEVVDEELAGLMKTRRRRSPSACRGQAQRRKPSGKEPTVTAY